MFNRFNILAVALIALVATAVTSCTEDLNTSPLDDDVVTSASVYETPEDYRQVLAKLYAGYATTGQQGPAGDPDIQGIDEGFSSYIRQLWVSQELPTDEAVVGWNDPGLPQFNYQAWNASNDFVMGMYSRIYYEIALTNEFIRNAQQSDDPQIQGYLAEARFLRALSYWHALDLYGGGVPFVTEDDDVGAYQPEPISADSLFGYIESELQAIESNLPAPGQNEYARADQAAAWTLLTKLYLNAEVYVGEAHYTEAITYADRVITEGGYTLDDNYGDLFLADNHTAEGVIFPIAFDGQNTQTYGGTTFIAHAAVGGSMIPGEYGLDDAWAGHRVTPEFVDIVTQQERFEGYTTSNPENDDEVYVPGSYQDAGMYGSNWTPGDAPPLVSDSNNGVYEGHIFVANAQSEIQITPERDWDTSYGDNEGDGTLEAGGSNIVIQKPGLHYFRINLNEMTYEIRAADSRNTLYTDGQEKSISDLAEFTNGYAITKWQNVDQNGNAGSNLTFVDIDFPMFRLADVYLMYAEAVVRGGNGGDMNTAVSLVNDLRERAYGDDTGNITSSQLTLDFILNERARELYWEGHRRTDLNRFNRFTGDEYVWSWKGEDQDGLGTSDNYRVFPLPASDVNSNTNLTQNQGY